MTKLFELMLSGFWQFCGGFLILYMLLYFPTNLIIGIAHKYLRARTIRLRGYPPYHCDGDGDFRKLNIIKDALKKSKDESVTDQK